MGPRYMSQFYEGFWLYIYLTMCDIISYTYAINNLVSNIDV